MGLRLWQTPRATRHGHPPRRRTLGAKEGAAALLEGNTAEARAENTETEVVVVVEAEEAEAVEGEVETPAGRTVEHEVGGGREVATAVEAARKAADEVGQKGREVGTDKEKEEAKRGQVEGTEAEEVVIWVDSTGAAEEEAEEEAVEEAVEEEGRGKEEAHAVVRKAWEEERPEENVAVWEVVGWAVRWEEGRREGKRAQERKEEGRPEEGKAGPLVEEGKGEDETVAESWEGGRQEGRTETEGEARSEGGEAEGSQEEGSEEEDVRTSITSTAPCTNRTEMGTSSCSPSKGSCR